MFQNARNRAVAESWEFLHRYVYRLRGGIFIDTFHDTEININCCATFEDTAEQWEKSCVHCSTMCRKVHFRVYLSLS
jgi:hypothetical protein